MGMAFLLPRVLSVKVEKFKLFAMLITALLNLKGQFISYQVIAKGKRDGMEAR